MAKRGVAIRSFIEGAEADSLSAETVPLTNPSTAASFGTMPAGSAADARRAAAVARKAFDDGRWSAKPPSYRKTVLSTFAENVEKNQANLDALDAEDMGKPVSETFGNAAAAAKLLRYCAEAVDKLSGDVHSSDEASLVFQRFVPRGVVAAITPWNFPTYAAVTKIAPALAAGNCLILKPSEMSPRSALLLAQLALEAGLPAGVFNVLLGLGHIVGQQLGLDLDVDMLSFTGSSDVGKLMLQYAGQSNLKSVIAECGGKSPHIVLAGLDEIRSVGEFIARAITTNQGQICSVGSRVLVHRSVEKPLIEAVVESLRNIRAGNALARDTNFGPVASSTQLSRVMSYIQTARQEGAQLVAGGDLLKTVDGGYFVQPTVFRGVQPEAKIAQEEIFGPVLSFITFDRDEEAIQIANGTAYGLAAYVWTNNISSGMRVAKGVRCPVWINARLPSGEGAGYSASFEPSHLSGIGVEGGMEGIRSYLRRQLMWINH